MKVVSLTLRTQAGVRLRATRKYGDGDDWVFVNNYYCTPMEMEGFTKNQRNFAFALIPTRI